MVYNILNRLRTQATRMSAINADPLGTIAYHRDGQIINIAASIGRTQGENIIPEVSVIQVTYQDFFVETSDLIISGTLFLPRVDDIIQRQNDEKYIVISLDDGSPPFEYVTTLKQRVRIHTNRITNDSAVEI
jgi:hypothetical protein